MRKNFDGSLYLVIERSMIQKPFEDFLIEALQGGVTAVQLREKSGSTRDYIELAKRTLKILKPFQVSLLINDRVDVALAAQAHGVHLGQDDFPFSEARQILGKESIIGVTIESEEQVPALENEDIDYWGVSSVFPTETKKDISHVWGLEGLTRLRQKTSRTLIAIGGITIGNSQQVLQSGADGIAVVSAICRSEDPYKAAHDLSQTLRLARGSHE
jgi:thiamine-phosphate pyrophosphorylase